MTGSMNGYQTNERFSYITAGVLLFTILVSTRTVQQSGTNRDKETTFSRMQKLYYYGTSLFYLIQFCLMMPNFMHYTFQKYF
jgi:hypothetical protein